MMDPRELEKQVKGETSDFTLKERLLGVRAAIQRCKLSEADREAHRKLKNKYKSNK